MNCIAATLLTVLKNEETCFFMFVSIIKEWQLEKVFEPGLPDLLLREFQFNYYAKRIFPELYNHFKIEGITTGFFMARWFLTIFSIYLPLQVVEKAWDCIFYSKWKAIIKIALALMDELKGKLLHMDKAGISSFIRDSVREGNSDYKAVLCSALPIKVTNKKLLELAEQFYIHIANYKLNNPEPYFTPEENLALAETKSKIVEIDLEKLVEIKEIQGTVEFYGKEIARLQKEYKDLTEEISNLENSIENLCELKAIYIKSLEEMQEKHLSDLKTLKVPVNSLSYINKEDVLQAQDKVRVIDENLKDLTKDYINKVISN